MRRMSCSAVEGPRGGRCETKLVEVEKRKKEGPTWEAFRSRIFSFARDRSREIANNRAIIFGQRSPVTSPCSRSPIRSPVSTSPTGRSPMSRSPNNRSPSYRSPQSRSPVRSPTRPTSMRTHGAQSPLTPLHRSPSGGSPPTHTMTFQPTKRRGSRGSRESLSGPDTPTSNKGRRDSPTIETPTGPIGKRGRLRTFSLSFDSEAGSMTSSLDSPCTPSTSSGRKVQLKMRTNEASSGRRASPDHHNELSQIDDERNMEFAAQRPRKWSYHGTASPSAPVEIPKRHSFSTGTEQPHNNDGGLSGIVVSNSDLLSLLQPSQLLAFPGLQDLKQFRTVVPVNPSCPKPRGRSQSIAVCAQSAPLLPPNIGGVEGAPIIRTTDCDHEASVLARASTLEENLEEGDESAEEKLVWDSTGSTVNVGLLGSVIESYLKTSTDDEPADPNNKKETSTKSLTAACGRLQVK